MGRPTPIAASGANLSHRLKRLSNSTFLHLASEYENGNQYLEALYIVGDGVTQGASVNLSRQGGYGATQTLVLQGSKARAVFSDGANSYYLTTQAVDLGTIV
jgi:hypothetical protein